MNSAFCTTRRIALFGASVALLAAFGAAPASATVGSAPVPFNGFFNTTVSRTDNYVTGTGISTDSPLGIVTESYSFRDYGNITPEHNENIGGTIQFSDGSSILYAVLSGDPLPAMNYYNFGAYVPFVFSPTLSTGKFAGAIGEGQLIASIWNPTTRTNTHQLSNTVIKSLPAVPETSSVVSLDILLLLGIGGAAMTARKKRII